jgi:alpha-beta hydrolase superfamily lysophospholipase
METGEWAIKNAQKIKLPMLVLHGTSDRLTNYNASEEFVKNAGKNVRLKLYEGAYHELHHDYVKKEVLHEIVTFIVKTIT